MLDFEMKTLIFIEVQNPSYFGNWQNSDSRQNLYKLNHFIEKIVLVWRLSDHRATGSRDGMGTF